jgi:hypothetical protein
MGLPSPRTLPALAAAALLAAACAGGGAPVPPAPPPLAAAPEQEAFWASLQRLCGGAYAGRLDDVTAYYRPMLEGQPLVAHFRECAPERMHVALHVGGNRSRNWILTRTGGTIRLKHDHRYPDGREEAVSQYGGDAPVPGLAHRQIFPADAHTARILPARADNFWFLELADGATLHYGVHWPTAGHSVRIAFDLSAPVAPPPPPWGYGVAVLPPGD